MVINNVSLYFSTSIFVKFGAKHFELLDFQSISLLITLNSYAKCHSYTVSTFKIISVL